MLQVLIVYKYRYKIILCFCRSNPRHRLEQAHPGDEDYTISQLPTPVDGAPKCKYGRHCYRRNAEHFRDFRHPRNCKTN